MTTPDQPADVLRAAAAVLERVANDVDKPVASALALAFRRLAWVADLDADLLHRVVYPELLFTARAVLAATTDGSVTRDA